MTRGMTRGAVEPDGRYNLAIKVAFVAFVAFISLHVLPDEYPNDLIQKVYFEIVGQQFP